MSDLQINGIVYGVLLGVALFAGRRAAARAPIALRDLALTIHWSVFGVVVMLGYIAYRM